jgi:hypothetical protein
MNLSKNVLSMIKESIFIILLCCFTGTWAMAQNGHHRGGHPKGPKPEMTEEMKTALNLTDEQRTQLDALQAENEEAIQALKHDQENVRSAMRELHETNKAKLESILTEDQLTALPSLRQAEYSRQHPTLNEADRQALREEMKRYHTENIEPVMLAQRQKLENVLSAADRDQLATIRTQLAAAKEERKAAREATEGNDTDTEQRLGNRRPPANGKRAGHHPRGSRIAKQFPEQHEALVGMASKYEEQISSLLAELEPQRAQWKAGQEAIRAKYLPAEAGEGKRRPQASGEEGTEKAGKREMGAKSDSYRIHFLLLDGNVKQD